MMKNSNEKKVVYANQDAGWEGMDEKKWEEYVATYATKEFGCSLIYDEPEMKRLNQEINDFDHPYIYPKPLSADDKHRWKNRKLKKSICDFVAKEVDNNYHTTLRNRIVKECKEMGFTDEVAIDEAIGISLVEVGNGLNYFYKNTSLKGNDISFHIPWDNYTQISTDFVEEYDDE